MTLGRTPTGAIKIKTDGGFRAVECACCGSCDCENLPLGKYKIASVNFGNILNPDAILVCSSAVAAISNGATVSMVWQNCSEPYWTDWIIYCLGAQPFECSNLVAFVSGSPVGTHTLFGCWNYDNASPNPCDSCAGWTVTIEEVFD
jgi:hypothetical protein